MRIIKNAIPIWFFATFCIVAGRHVEWEEVKILSAECNTTTCFYVYKTDSNWGAHSSNEIYEVGDTLRRECVIYFSGKQPDCYGDFALVQ